MKSGRVFLTAAVCWMALIFFMSSRDGTESSRDSMAVGSFVCRILYRDYGQMSPEERREKAAEMDFAVRKCAHAAEYAVLGFLALMTLKKYGRRRIVPRALIWAAGYAVTDEIHQYCVPGRMCSLRDICIDSAGAVIGILLALLLVKRRLGSVS